MELEIIGLISMAGKNTKLCCEFLRGGWGKQTLGWSLFCVWFTFNTLFDGKHKFCEFFFFSF